MRFLNPKKLGAASESWLRHEVLGFECTAAMCLYFFSSFCLGLPLTIEACLEELRPFGFDGANEGTSVLVDIAVPIDVAMVSILSSDVEKLSER